MPIEYPPYIFGMHDRGGEHLMLEKKRRGWVLITEELGADPNNPNGSNYTDLTNKGLGVIVRLNHGYGSAGTIPHSSQYDNFARRCGNFVQDSPGCHIWIIGNEMNLANERPGGPSGQTITPQLYADCFRKCRTQIRSRPGHADDQVVIGAIAPWNTQTKYSGNSSGDWIQYFRDVLDLLGDAVDGISVHTYTHGQNPDFVFSDATMNPPFQNYHWHFRTYRDFMTAIPQALRDRPVYITEADEDDPWQDANNGWVQNAYREIDRWNQQPSNQPIQALILYRWIIGNPNDPQQVGWAIVNKPGVQDDFRAAMNNQYRLVLPQVQPAYRVAWLEVNAPGRFDRGADVQFSVGIRNDGRQTWAATGGSAVQLGYRWIDASGTATEGGRTPLPSAVAPSQTVTLPAVTVRAPDQTGLYTLELDLVEGASGWFAQQGSPAWRAEAVRVGDRYRVAWLNVAAPTSGKAGETVRFQVRMRNDGALTWTPGGNRPFNLTYKWLAPDRQEVVPDGLRTPLPGNVAPGEEVTVQASVQFPAEAGEYILMLDLVEERVTWFHSTGSPPHETQVQVAAGRARLCGPVVGVRRPPELPGRGDGHRPGAGQKHRRSAVAQVGGECGGTGLPLARRPGTERGGGRRRDLASHRHHPARQHRDLSRCRDGDARGAGGVSPGVGPDAGRFLAFGGGGRRARRPGPDHGPRLRRGLGGAGPLAALDAAR